MTNTSVAKTDTCSDQGAPKINTASQQNEICSMQCRTLQEPGVLVELNVPSSDEQRTPSNVLQLQEATEEKKALQSTIFNDEPMESKPTPQKTPRDSQSKVASMAQTWNVQGNDKIASQRNKIPSSQRRSANGLEQHLPHINEKTVASAVFHEPTPKNNDKPQQPYLKQDIQPKPTEGRASLADPIPGKATDILSSQNSKVASMAQAWNAKSCESNKKPKLQPWAKQSIHNLRDDQGNRKTNLMTVDISYS